MTGSLGGERVTCSLQKLHSFEAAKHCRNQLLTFLALQGCKPTAPVPRSPGSLRVGRCSRQGAGSTVGDGVGSRQQSSKCGREQTAKSRALRSMGQMAEQQITPFLTMSQCPDRATGPFNKGRGN